MASSEAEICNLALQEIGAQRILSLNDNTPEGKICKDFYANVRDEMLRSHPWKFATKRVALALITPDVPAFGFDNYFQLPADCLRVLKVEGDEQAAWTVEGNRLLTDDSTATIKYIAKITNVALYDPTFVQALALKLAYKISFGLVQSTSLRQSLQVEYLEAVRTARSFNGQEGAGDRVYADDWLNSRF